MLKNLIDQLSFNEKHIMEEAAKEAFFYGGDVIEYARQAVEDARYEWTELHVQYVSDYIDY